MRDESSKYKTYTRRSVVLGSIKLSVLTLILGRYYYLQIINSDKYKTMSEKNHIKLQIVPAPRGRLLDRYGNELVTNSFNYSLGVPPDYVKKVSEIVTLMETALNRKLNISETEIAKKLRTRQRTSPLILEEKLAWDDLAKVSEALSDIPGADVFTVPMRNYLLADKAAHITGYIGSPTPQEIEKYGIENFSEVKIGKSGLEKQLDASIRGKVGYKKNEVDVKGQVIRELSEQ
jgi:penicillin-binding protein 2